MSEIFLEGHILSYTGDALKCSYVGLNSKPPNFCQM